MRGRIREASNAVLYCTVSYEGREAACVYKPVAGERPLWDFPDGTLAQREVAAYEVSEATGWGLVPPTVLRDGPYGEGMCQLWIEGEPGSELLALVDGEEAAGRAGRPSGSRRSGTGRPRFWCTPTTERLRRLAVLDAVVNNADRKGGHLLPAAEGRLYGIDHGVTFNVENKLRTLLWGWAGEPLTEEAVEVLRRLRDALDEGGTAGREAGLVDHPGGAGRHAGAGGRAADERPAPGAERGVAGDPLATGLTAPPAGADRGWVPQLGGHGVPPRPPVPPGGTTARNRGGCGGPSTYRPQARKQRVPPSAQAPGIAARRSG